MAITCLIPNYVCTKLHMYSFHIRTQTQTSILYILYIMRLYQVPYYWTFHSALYSAINMLYIVTTDFPLNLKGQLKWRKFLLKYASLLRHTMHKQQFLKFNYALFMSYNSLQLHYDTTCSISSWDRETCYYKYYNGKKYLF